MTPRAACTGLCAAPYKVKPAADVLPLQEWHREEIDKRLDALEQGTSVGAPWPAVRRRITGNP